MADIERRELTEIFGIALTLREPVLRRGGREADIYNRNQLVLARKDNGAIVASVDREGLFDRDGNYFMN